MKCNFVIYKRNSDFSTISGLHALIKLIQWKTVVPWCKPLLPKVRDSNPDMGGFYLWDFSTQTVKALVKQTSSMIDIN